MMQFAVICIGGLNAEMLSNLTFDALDRLSCHDIVSTTPSFPITAWTSAWTGTTPEMHGKIPGLKSKRVRLDNVLEQLKRDGTAVETYQEDDLHVHSNAHVGIFRVDSIAEHILQGDFVNAQESLDRLDMFLESLPIPYLVISVFGAALYDTCLNVDRYLVERGLMVLDEHDQIQYDKSSAYPVNYGGSKPRMTYGVIVNTQDGIYQEAMSVQGDLLERLNMVDDIEAVVCHEQYDIKAYCYDDMPDIVLKSDRTYYQCAGATETEIVVPYSRYNLSSTGMVMSSPDSLIDGIESVLDVKKAIMRGVTIGGQR